MTFVLVWQFSFKVSNAGIGILLLFLKSLIRAIGVAYHSPQIIDAAGTLPQTLNRASIMCNLAVTSSYQVYVVCTKCQSLFPNEYCRVVATNGDISSRCCPFIPLQRHRRHQSVACGKPLLCESGNKGLLKPAKIFCYQSLHAGLQNVVRRGLLDDCEHWRKRTPPANVLADVYDGKLWHDFADFLSAPSSLLLCLNVDWFQPFQHVTYSVGAIYLSILNLPRSKRHLFENIILIGIIPGPNEPSLTINSYLTPLVKELKSAWVNGIEMKNDKGISVTVRVALGSVNCDIRASRKVVGFLAHRAVLGCNKCLKQFTTTASQTDYSGFERQSWPMRNNEQHRRDCKRLESAKTKISLKVAEAKYGVRNSILLSLPYFDPIQQCPIDPMHNLFMGTGKHAIEVWIQKGLLTRGNMEVLEKLLRKFFIPDGMDRSPCTLANFSGFTANQWKNWIIVYSSIVLKTVLPEPDYNCWLLFVRACSLLLSGAITFSNIEQADEFLCMFCSRFQELYGEESCTFNMHLHLHLKESLMAYGPLHSFWCFSFERYNGILTGYHTNKRQIEAQLMKRFLFDQRVHAMVHSGDIGDNEFLQLIPGFNEQAHECYTWNAFNTFWNIQGVSSIRPLQGIQSQPTTDYSFQSVSPYVSLPAQSSDGILEQVQCNALHTVYQLLHPGYDIQFIPYAYKTINWIMCAGDRIGSQSISTSSSIICAYWPGFSETIEEFGRHTSELRVGEIQHFLLHTVHLTHQQDLMPVKKVCHLLAYVLWKKVHRYPLWFGMDSLLSSCDHEPPSAASFIPITNIQGRCAHATLKVQFDDDASHTPENVFVAVPLRFQISD